MARIEDRNGSYTTRVSLTHPLTGKRTQKRVTARTKAELRAKVRDLENRNADGKRATPEKMKLGEWLETWIPLYRQSDHSQFQREGIIRVHIIGDEIADIPIGLIQTHHIQHFIDRKAERYSTSYLEGMLSTLSLALDAARRRGMIDSNPTSDIELPAHQKRPWVVLDQDQARTLVDYAREERHSAFWVLAVTLGIRRGELLALRWSDIDLPRRTMMIQRTMSRRKATGGRGEWYIKSIPKTQAGHRSLKLPDVCLSALQQHRTRWLERRLAAGSAWSGDDAVFDDGLGRHYAHPNMPANDLRRIKKRCGFHPKLRIHDLRHTAATHMLMNRIPVATVSRILGHANPAITYRIYAHVIQAMEDEAIRVIDAQYGVAGDGDEEAIVTIS